MFHPIDTAAWPRAQLFYYFRTMAPTGYSMTVQVDVTRLRSVLKRSGHRFFPAYLWLVTRNLSRQPEFTTAVKDGVLGYHDALTPLYAHWHDDDKTISLMWTAFDEDFRAFHDAYLRNQRDYGANHGVLSRPELPPDNAYTVSETPWTHFSHFAVHSFGEPKDYFFPSVEAGRFEERDGRLWMPLSLTCHHATTDGYHVARFLDDLQADMDGFERFV